MCAAVCDRAEQQLGIDAIGAANCSDRPSMISVHNRHMESGTRKYLQPCDNQSRGTPRFPVHQVKLERGDRKSTRLNSSHGYISYAVFCLKKKKNNFLAHPRNSTFFES